MQNAAIIFANLLFEKANDVQDDIEDSVGHAFDSVSTTENHQEDSHQANLHQADYDQTDFQQTNNNNSITSTKKYKHNLTLYKPKNQSKNYEYYQKQKHQTTNQYTKQASNQYASSKQASSELANVVGSPNNIISPITLYRHAKNQNSKISLNVKQLAAKNKGKHV